MALATVERPASNFTLHRSETVAHSAGLLDRKHTAASSRARGRSEGFACKHSENFKPLGLPVPPERVTEMHNSILGKVARIEAAVALNADSQHQDKRDKERNRRRELEIERAMKERAERTTSPDAKDGVKDEVPGADEASLEAEREEMLSLRRLPHALYGKDLPRCGQLQERQEKDGFNHLKMHIKESFRRVEQVKSDADAAYEARNQHMQLMLPSPRQQRPASPEEASSAFLTAVDLPHSAREPRGRPPRDAPRRPSIQGKANSQKRGWLPSLAEYLALDGLAPERSEKPADPGRQKDIIKEIVSQLIPLPKGPRPNFQQDEGKAGAGKSRWLTRRKMLEKELNDAWKDKAFYKRCTPFIPQRDAEEYRRQYHDDEHKLATIERFLKDLGVNEDLKDPKPPEGALDRSGERQVAQDQPLPAANSEPSFGALDKRRNGDEEGVRVEATRGPESLVVARARFRAIHEKAMAQQREPDDPAASPLAILRTAVYDYQAVRDGARKKLQDTLETQEKSRLATMEKLPPLRPEVRGLGDREPDHRQHQWYRSLLEQVRAQGELGNLKATHALMDAVKAVLDRSSELLRLRSLVQRTSGYAFRRWPRRT
ncbi:unnamed protein product [Durusdinium trenchii]|uniref:Uncharacterized protein n=1 Tax=Durusdinium trenchii TaxID=1381693 RepID=A0ABP0SJ14_9DINO